MESTEFESTLDTFDTESESEFSERRRRWGGRGGVSRPQGRPLTSPQPQQGYVTRNEFNTAMEKVRSELASASSGLRTLEGRVNTLATGQERLTREAAARKRENEALRRDLKSTREMAAIIPLIAANTKTEKLPSTQDIPAALQGKEISVPSGNNLATFAPLLLLGGSDSSSGSSGSSGGFLGGSDSNMMLLLLLFAFNK